MITIDNNQTEVIIDKMFFTTGGDFFLSGSNYIGYVNIVDGAAFEGKFNQTQILQPSNNIRSLINIDKEIFFDRTLSDTISLPYTKEDIKIQPNELINRNSFNFKIGQLYDNFKELYRFSEMSVPNIPRNFTGFAAASGDGGVVPVVPGEPPYSIHWVPSDFKTDNYVPFTEYNPNFKGNNEFFNLFTNNTQDNVTIFFSVSNTLFVYETDNPLPGSGVTHSSFAFILSSNTFGNYGELIFGDISNTTDDGDKILYVADRLKNNIHKFDVSSLVNTDRTGVKQFRLIDTIGGTGTLESNFESIEKIEYGKDFLFVYDDTEFTIKKFTKELNFVAKYTNKKFFKDNTVMDITTDPYKNFLYILTKTFKIQVIRIKDLTFVTTYDLGEENFGTTRPNRFIVSTNNSNIYYLQTTKDIFKGHLSKLNEGYDSVIGRFKIKANVNFDKPWGEYEDQNDYWKTDVLPSPAAGIQGEWNKLSDSTNFNFTGLERLPLESNFEKIYTITDRSILEFTENSAAVNLLSDERPTFFDLEEIEVKDDYFNAFNYNSSLYKLAFNVNLLNANICKALKVQFVNTRKEFLSFNNIDPDTIDNIKLLDQNELYVGVNEVISTNVFNRTVEKLYDYQELLLQAYKIKVVNTKIPPLSTTMF
tara:strand:- start:14933 stop:16873 length:1941 start_codon:yes stop_codon:yes gene_type:complete